MIGAAALALIILVPLALSMVDMVPIARARRTRGWEITDETPSVHDFVILVPIYGSIAYLENVEYLSPYRERVWLCTTSEESHAFNAGLDAIAGEHGFTIFRGSAPRSTPDRGHTRAVAGTIRDRLIRDASAQVEAPYLVCLDADTRTEQPLDRLVGAIAKGGWDLVSVRLCPSNRDTWLSRIQGHEYRMAMRLRRIMPWLVSGACHAARTEAHRELMARHSLFFQGNDAEVGLLAHAMGYQVGHVLFDVSTAVPSRWWPWLRQRLAWAGGEFRLFIVNMWLLPKHPAAFAYGALFVFLLLPFRWWAMFQPHWLLTMTVVYILYLTAMVVVNWRNRDLALLLVPWYGLLIIFFISPFGLVWYARMAWTDRNLGLIRPGRRTTDRVEQRVSNFPAIVSPLATPVLPAGALLLNEPETARLDHRAEPQPAVEARVAPTEVVRAELATELQVLMAQLRAVTEVMTVLIHRIASPTFGPLPLPVSSSASRTFVDDMDDPFSWPSEEELARFAASKSSREGS